MPEPTFDKDAAPRVYSNEPGLRSAGTSSEEAARPAPQSGSSLSEENRKLLTALSKDLDDLSKPYEPPSSPKEEEPPRRLEDDRAAEAYFEEEESSGSVIGGIFRFILMLCSLLAVIAAAWQVCLFLQPEFMQQEPVKTFSNQSCEFFYCPPLREPRIMNSELQATGPDEWEVRFTMQNPDLRPQPIPPITLTLKQGTATIMKNIFEQKDFKVTPNVPQIGGGEAVQISVPFRLANDRPTSFIVKVLQNP